MYVVRSLIAPLYLIEILHQTTTNRNNRFTLKMLYLIEILHQTTTFSEQTVCIMSCILSKFYIKPQLKVQIASASAVVSYRNSTSNHNPGVGLTPNVTVVSYRNSTSNHNSANSAHCMVAVVSYRNSTSNHNDYYAKEPGTFVVSYRNSTSNHNVLHSR